MYVKYDLKKEKLLVKSIIIFLCLFFAIFITYLRSYINVRAGEKTAIILSSSRKKHDRWRI